MRDPDGLAVRRLVPADSERLSRIALREVHVRPAPRRTECRWFARLSMAARRMLPGRSCRSAATTERLSLLGYYRRILLGNACAAVKSAEILMGGLRVYNAAAFAVALTAIEDAFALHRARQSCRSDLALLAVERDHAVHLAGEAVRRTGLMARIARDVGEEAAYPVHVRIELHPRKSAPQGVPLSPFAALPDRPLRPVRRRGRQRQRPSQGFYRDRK